MDLVTLGALMVVGIPVRAAWRELWVEMPEAWRRFMTRHTEIEHREGGQFIDVSLEKTGDRCLQLVCLKVSGVGSVPEGMRAIEIPAQRYIHHRHVGRVAGIAESFGRIYDWASEQGHAAGEFKLDIRRTDQDDEREHDLYVGLLPPTPWSDVE